MCGVIGMFAPDPGVRHLEAVCRLFEQSQIRGLHSFGITAWVGASSLQDGLETKKAFTLDKIKAGILEYKHRPPELLIGHNRYSTSGDYHDHANNQPIHIPGISLVFNGVITQATKDQYEKIFGKRYQTENDGEIFSRKVLDGEDWARFVADGRFSFAGLFVRNGEAFAIRNRQRPLYMGNAPGGVFFASTADIFKRAGGFARVREVPAGKPLKIDESLL